MPRLQGVDPQVLDLTREPADAYFVCSAPTFHEAQRAVDELSKADFPVQQLSIVARGLKLVEKVRGKRTALGSMASTTFIGAAFGAVMGALFGLFSIVEPVISVITLAGWGAVIGAIAGAPAGLTLWFFKYRASGAGYLATDGISAESYDVVCEKQESVEIARNALRAAGFDAPEYSGRHSRATASSV